MTIADVYNGIGGLLMLSHIFVLLITHTPPSKQGPSVETSTQPHPQLSCLPLGGGVVQQVTFARIQVIIALEAEAQNSQMCQLFGQPCTILQQVRKDFPRGWTNLL